LTERGHWVTAIDPARASLDMARARLGATRPVDPWRRDPSAAASVDLATMTGNVAQAIADDAD